MPEHVFHFSEDPTIRRFVPHVPATNPGRPPAVWAIDEAHAALYWFPRQCPRVAAWWRTDGERARFEATFTTTARRVHAIELAWLDAMRTTVLHRYRFDASVFVPWTEAEGQWISTDVVEPLAVEPMGDLLDAHGHAGIELRAAPSLWPLHDLVRSDRWGYGIVRMANARPRS